MTVLDQGDYSDMAWRDELDKMLKLKGHEPVTRFVVK